MNLEEFKKDFIRKELEIADDYGKIFSFIDFSNVNKWFENDNQDWNNKLLAYNEKLSIDLEKIKSFADIFSDRVRIYYGEDPKKQRVFEFYLCDEKIIWQTRGYDKRFTKNKTLF